MYYDASIWPSWNPLLIGVGDVLERPKGLFPHKGVCVRADWRGIWVLHLTPEWGIRLSLFDEFADGKTVTVARKAQPTEIPTIIARAQAELERPTAYDAGANNCQHLVGRVVFGEHKSETVRQLVIVMAASIFIGALASLRA